MSTVEDLLEHAAVDRWRGTDAEEVHDGGSHVDVADPADDLMVANARARRQKARAPRLQIRIVAMGAVEVRHREHGRSGVDGPRRAWMPSKLYPSASWAKTSPKF